MAFRFVLGFGVVGGNVRKKNEMVGCVFVGCVFDLLDFLL